MKEIFPAPPAIVRNDYESVRELFTKNVVPSYGRFELVLSHGAGSTFLMWPANAIWISAAALR